MIQVTSNVTKPNGATGKAWSVLVENEPCKLSFFSAIGQNGTASPVVGADEVTQQTKLFIRSDLVVPAGSRITVTRKNRVMYYEASSVAQVFTNHQEILMKEVQKWA